MHYSEKHRTTARIRRNDRLFLIDTSGKEIKIKQNKQYIYIQKKGHHILWMIIIQQTTKSNSYAIIMALLNKNQPQ